MKELLTWIAYLALGALSLSVAGGLITLALSVGAMVLLGGGVIFIGAFVVFCVKELLYPTPKDKQ